MSKVTVGAVFQAYQIADRKRINSADKSAKGGNYGQALVASVALAEALEKCQVEIELSTKAMSAVVPFLSAP